MPVTNVDTAMANLKVPEDDREDVREIVKEMLAAVPA